MSRRNKANQSYDEIPSVLKVFGPIDNAEKKGERKR